MILRRFCRLNLNNKFHSLRQPVNVNQQLPSIITANPVLVKGFSSSVEDDPPGPPSSNAENDVDRKIKFIQSEMTNLRDRGHEVPESNSVKQKHWQELLKMRSTYARRKYYHILYVNEKRNENKKLKKQEIARANQAFKEQQKEVDNPHITYSLYNTSMFLRIQEDTMNLWRNFRLIQAMQFGAKLIFDCSYDQYMSGREAHSAAKQLLLSFVQNRRHKDPFDLHFCNVDFNGDVFKRLQSLNPRLGKPGYPLTLHEGSYLDHFPKEKIVYLTPHCRNDFTEFDSDSIYIIGAMVDTRNREPLSMMKAKELGLKMARLPLDGYLGWGLGSGKALTLDQIMKIMLELKASRCWTSAILKHIPRRKVANKELYDREAVSKWPTKSNQFGKNFGSEPNTFDDEKENPMSTAEKFKRKIETATDDEISNNLKGNVRPSVAFKRTGSTSSTGNSFKKRIQVSSGKTNMGIDVKKLFE